MDKDKLMSFLRRQKENRGAMASLRCLLNDEQRFRGWQLIASINGIGNAAVETVAGLYAMHPEESSDADYNFGDACRALAMDRKTMEVNDESPFDRRFRRLLSCDTREELRSHLVDIVRGMKSANIVVNYAGLYQDMVWWGNKVRERWAIHYWSNRKVETVENVSD